MFIEELTLPLPLGMGSVKIVESLANMVAVGTSVHIATMLGKENRQEASRAFSFSVKFILLFSTMTSLNHYK